MYHQSSKRKELLRRTLVYGVMCLSVVALVIVLLFIIQGYRFNRLDGRIEQGGLLQFDTRPGGADISVDGTPLSGRTASKVTVSSGSHAVVMSRTGYLPWQKTITVAPGSVVWLDYARLIPEEIKKEDVARFTIISGSLASPDAKWMAIKEEASSPSITLVDISREVIRQSTLEIPATAFTPPTAGKAQSFSLEAWDSGSRYIIVKHLFNDGQLEWLMVDTQNVAQTVNVTKLTGVAVSKVVFSGASSNNLFVQVGSDVRKVDISAATLSRPLISNVAEFWLYDRTTLVFTTALSPDTGTRSAGYYEDGAEKPHVLKTYTDNGAALLKVALGKYFNEPYVALAYGDAVDVYRGKLPSDQADVSSMTLATSFAQAGGVDYLEIRNNGRFVVAQKGSELQVYDAELKQLSKTVLKDGGGSVGKLGWLDGYYAWSDLGGKLRFYEFDGTNQHDIMSVAPGHAVTLANDGLFAYGVTVADSQYHLSRARLQVN